MLRPAALVLLAILALGSMPAQAWADAVRSWILETQSGQVRLVKSGITPIALTVGDVFAGGDWIETGPDGRAILRRGEETIVVAPNSRIGLPSDNIGPFATRILQTLGTILLTVEKKANQHFEVRTPYLAAVVKGTTFTVGLEGARAVVHVVEGLVEVENLASGRSSLVHPGQTGLVERGGAADVKVIDGTVKAESEGPVAGAIVISESLGPKSVDFSANSGGLIRIAGTGGDWDGVQASGYNTGQPGVVEQTVDTALNATTTPTAGAAAAQALVSGPVASTLQPVTTTLGAGLQSATAPLSSIVEPVAGAVSSLVQPVTAPLTSIVQPVAAPLTGLVQPVTAPLTSIVQPITAPVSSLLQPVTAPITGIVQPVAAPPPPSGGSLLAPVIKSLL